MRPRFSAGVYAVTSERPAEDTGEPPAKKPAKEDDPLVKELKDLVGRNAEMIASNQKTIQLLLKQQKNQTQAAEKPMAQTGFGRGKTNFGGSCYYCKKPGHRMSECFKRKADMRRNSGMTSGQPQEFARSKPQEHGPSTGRTVNVVRGPCDAAEKESGLPFCELTIEGIEAVTCILDTGSVASIISDLFVGRTGKLSSMAPANHRNLTAADGGALAVLGSLSLQLALRDFNFQYTFEVVKDFQPTVLLGDDFLRHFKVVLDYEHGSVVLTLAPGKKVRLRLCGLFLNDDGLGKSDAELLSIEDVIGRVCAVTAPDHTYPTTTRIPQATPTIVDLETGDTLSWKPSSRVRISKELTAQQRKALEALIDSFADVFSQGAYDLGRHPTVKHRIDTGDAHPINQAPYRLTPEDRDVVERQIATMLENGIIRESRSAWASPIVLTDKKGTTEKRFCGNYIGLNKVTEKDRYPLPRIDDSLDALTGNLYFSCLDLAHGFWQVGVEPKDVEKTAIISPVGLYEFVVMPFGLCNAPSTFQRAMDTVLAGLKWHTCLVYIDDVLVFSPTFEDHLKDLQAVLQRFREHNLKLKPTKCAIAQQSLRYLGYVVTPAGIRVDPEKVRAVREILPPATKSELRSFLGLTSYYRRFVKAYAERSEPLSKLLRDATPYVWSDEQQKAFEALKLALTEAPLLTHPDWDKDFVLQTNASDLAIAAVLSQRDAEALQCALGYASRQLSDLERKYVTREKELIAVVWGCETYAKYLEGRPFIIETDHANLRWLMGKNQLKRRLARWVLRLQAFDFEIRHRPGKANANADALSRLPTAAATVEATGKQKDLLLIRGPRVDIPDREELRKMQEQDSLYAEVMEYLKRPQPQEAPTEVKEVLRDTGYIYVDPGTGLLMHQAVRNGSTLKVPFLPPAGRREVMRALHDLPMSGHLGYNKTYEKMRSQFYWKGMGVDIKDFVRTCASCQSRKPPQPKRSGEMQLFSATRPFEVVGVDLLGPLTRTTSGNKHIVVIVDRFSRWVELAAVPDITTNTVADVVVDRVILRHGCPVQLLSDRGTVHVWII